MSTDNKKADAGTDFDPGLAKELAALAARAMLIEKRRQTISDVDELFRTISENLVMIIVGERATEQQKNATTNMVLGMMFDCYEKASQLILVGWCDWTYVTITSRLREYAGDIVRRFQTGVSAGEHYENVHRAIGKLHDILCEVANNKQ